jgi:hypothetical protein
MIRAIREMGKSERLGVYFGSTTLYVGSTQLNVETILTLVEGPHSGDYGPLYTIAFLAGFEHPHLRGHETIHFVRLFHHNNYVISKYDGSSSNGQRGRRVPQLQWSMGIGPGLYSELEKQHPEQVREVALAENGTDWIVLRDSTFVASGDGVSDALRQQLEQFYRRQAERNINNNSNIANNNNISNNNDRQQVQIESSSSYRLNQFHVVQRPATTEHVAAVDDGHRALQAAALVEARVGAPAPARSYRLMDQFQVVHRPAAVEHVAAVDDGHDRELQAAALAVALASAPEPARSLHLEETGAVRLATVAVATPDLQLQHTTTTAHHEQIVTATAPATTTSSSSRPDVIRLALQPVTATMEHRQSNVVAAAENSTATPRGGAAAETATATATTARGTPAELESLLEERFLQEARSIADLEQHVRQRRRDWHGSLRKLTPGAKCQMQDLHLAPVRAQILAQVVAHRLIALLPVAACCPNKTNLALFAHLYSFVKSCTTRNDQAY